MNIQALMSLLSNASNPAQMLMSMLNTNQQQAVDLFRGKTSEQQAQEIAECCNKNNISKDQLKSLITLFSKR